MTVNWTVIWIWFFSTASIHPAVAVAAALAATAASNASEIIDIMTPFWVRDAFGGIGFERGREDDRKLCW